MDNKQGHKSKSGLQRAYATNRSETSLKYRNVLSSNGVGSNCNVYIRRSPSHGERDRYSYLRSGLDQDPPRRRNFFESDKVQGLKESRDWRNEPSASSLYREREFKSKSRLELTSPESKVFRERFRREYRPENSSSLQARVSLYQNSQMAPEPPQYSRAGGSTSNLRRPRPEEPKNDEKYSILSKKVDTLVDQVDQLKNALYQTFGDSGSRMGGTQSAHNVHRINSRPASGKNEPDVMSLQPNAKHVWSRPGSKMNDASNSYKNSVSGSTKGVKIAHIYKPKDFAEDRSSKADSSPVSKSSSEAVEIDRMSKKELLELRNKIDEKLSVPKPWLSATDFKKKSSRHPVIASPQPSISSSGFVRPNQASDSQLKNSRAHPIKPNKDLFVSHEKTDHESSGYKGNVEEPIVEEREPNTTMNQTYQESDSSILEIKAGIEKQLMSNNKNLILASLLQK